MNLKKMTIVITGAAGGIGFALSKGFLEDGANVVAIDIKSENLNELENRGAITEIIDITDYVQVQKMIQSALEKTGRIDALFNNAGLGEWKEIHNFNDDEYERFLRVNLFGPVYGIRAAIPVMRKQNFGRIINLVSRSAESGSRGMSAYASSKAALWAVTRISAVENIDYDILINGMIPGPTKSGMMPRGQEPSVVYPSARWMATLPKGGPTGLIFWNRKRYRMFDDNNETYRFNRRVPGKDEWEILKLEERVND